MLVAVDEMAPELFPLVHSAYSTPSSLYIGDESIQSAEGIQQGDPLGPLLFCLVDVLHDLQTVERKAGELGLQLNHSKSEIICVDDHTSRAMLQVAYCLLWHVFAIPKILYTLRSPPCFRSPELQSFDLLLRSLLSGIVNIDISI